MKNGNVKKTDWKVLLPIVIASILLISLGVFTVNYFEAWANMYVAPAGFKGKVTVIYGQPNGTPEKKKGKKRLFEIPTSGTLVTQSNYYSKWDDFYYRTADGELVQLPQGGPHGGSMPVAYNEADTIFIKNIQTSKLDSNGKEIYVTTYEIQNGNY